MKALPLAMVISALISAPSYAAPIVYGKANVALQNADENDESALELVSNASRIGLKGSEAVEGGLEFIYQMEFEVQLDDGNDKNGETFSQRNIYVGVKGDFGTVKAGKFDTPLKTSQNKVDLFNDLEGDIKHLITVNDNRPSNVVGYTTPALGNVKINAVLVASEDENVDNGLSVSVEFDTDSLHLSAAMDSGVEGEDEDALRLVGLYKFGQVQIGGLVEQYEDADGESYDAVMVSGAYKMNSWTLKAQLGQSDIVESEATAFSIGADYKFSKTLKTFFYFTNNTWDAEGGDQDDKYLGGGIEYKF